MLSCTISKVAVIFGTHASKPMNKNNYAIFMSQAQKHHRSTMTVIMAFAKFQRSYHFIETKPIVSSWHLLMNKKRAQ